MITPPLVLNKNECILLIALDPDDAASRYSKIANGLKPFGFRVIDELGSYVLSSVAVSEFSELDSVLIEILGRNDFVDVISNSDKGINVRVIHHRADDDEEIRSRANFWKPTWMK